MGIPEGLTTDTPESTQQVDYEKRFKDTQAFATRIAQEKADKERELEELKAELSVLKTTAKPSLTIDEQTQSELEDLKYSDPDGGSENFADPSLRYIGVNLKLVF